jgi:hypothetical protein
MPGMEQLNPLCGVDVPLHFAPAAKAGPAANRVPDDAVISPGSPAVDPPVVIPSKVAVVTSAEAVAMHLSPQQQTAITLLTAGRTRADAALAAGVSRSTLYRWFTDDPHFTAAFNTWQNDVRNTAKSQLLAVTHEAVAVVTNAIRRGDSRLAWKLLQAQNVTLPKVIGPTDPLELERRLSVKQQRKAAKLKKQEIDDRKQRNEMALEDMLNPEGVM